MVIKTYLKTLLKMFRRHIARFISLVAMVVISIGFVSGIGSAADKIPLLNLGIASQFRRLV